jgi:hypothetical protein
MGTVVFLLVCSGIALLWMVAVRRERRGQFDGAREALRGLGSAPVETREGVAAEVQGLAVSIRYDEPRTGYVARTVMTVALPSDAPRFELEMWPKDERRDTETSIDLDLEGSDFANAFGIEAAPSSVARALLDQPTIERLLALHPCHFVVSEREMRLTKQGQVAEPERVQHMVEALVALAKRVCLISIEQQEQRIAGAISREAYRGLSPQALDAANEDAPRKAQSELATLKDSRAHRAAAMRAVAITAAIVMFMLAAAVHMCR